MFVCICHGITDHTINQSVDSGATTMRCLAARLKVGKQCGKCVKTAKKVLDHKLRIASVNL